MRRVERLSRWKQAVLAILAILSPFALSVWAIPRQVTVSLPVAASIEGVTLDPGVYVMIIEGYDGSRATVRISREDSSSALVSAPVTSIQLPQAATRNAVKVVVHKGAYVLDKLLMAGETTALQFRLPA